MLALDNNLVRPRRGGRDPWQKAPSNPGLYRYDGILSSEESTVCLRVKNLGFAYPVDHRIVAKAPFLGHIVRLHRDSESLVVIQHQTKKIHDSKIFVDTGAGFTPSLELSELIREVSATESGQKTTEKTADNVSLTQVKSKYLKTVIYAMFQTIADSQQVKENTKRVALSDDSRFHEVIAKAILFRVNVSVYEYSNFLSKLHRELLNSIRVDKIASNNWMLVANNNELELEVSANIVQLPRPFRVRAKSYKPRMAYGANE